MGARFSASVQTGPGAHPASYTMGTGSFPGAESGRGVTLTHHPLLVPWSRKSRAIPLLPLWVYGLYRASVPAQGFTTLPYTTPRRNSEPPKTYKRRLYASLLTSIRATADYPEMRVEKLWPNTNWEPKRKNLNEAPVPANIRCTWYRVIHDKIPTNVRLHRIKPLAPEFFF